MCVVPVKLRRGNSGEILEIIALLDICSQDDFFREILFINLEVKERKTSITMKTLDGEVRNVTVMINELQVASGTKDLHD